MKKEIKMKKWHRYLVMGVLILLCVGLEYHFHIVQGITIVYTHLFYVPIVLAGLWWDLKGSPPLSILLASMHVACDLPDVSQGVFARAAALVFIGSVFGALSYKHKQADKRQQQFAEQLERTNIKLQEAERLKSIFLSTMSHELRTPLNSMIGFTSILLQGMAGEINDEQRKQLTIVKNNAYHLLSLINDLLDISKIEAGKVELTLSEFKLDDIVREVTDAFTHEMSKKNLKLVMEVPEEITLFSSKRHFKQILMNLLNNAVKFTQQGSIKVSARVLNDKILEMKISDTGIGMKEEHMNKLFMPFQQINESIKKSYEGTGLGLYLTKKLLAMLGGDITVKSKYGRGSEFTFTLPLKYDRRENK